MCCFIPPALALYKVFADVSHLRKEMELEDNAHSQDDVMAFTNPMNDAPAAGVPAAGVPAAGEPEGKTKTGRHHVPTKIIDAFVKKHVPATRSCRRSIFTSRSRPLRSRVTSRIYILSSTVSASRKHSKTSGKRLEAPTKICFQQTHQEIVAVLGTAGLTKLSRNWSALSCN